MKVLTSFLFVVALVAPTITASADAVPATAIARSNHVEGNASAARELKAMYKNCVPPPNAVTGEWYYDGIWAAYTGCTSQHESKPWIMLNAYQGGGRKRDNWRYQDDQRLNLPCLKDWNYYGKDGTWFIAKVDGEFTTQGETKPWCALPRYQKRGKQGYQWDYCTCEQA